MITTKITKATEKIWTTFENVPWHKLDPEVGIKLRALGAYNLNEYLPAGKLGELAEKEIKRFFALRLLEPNLQEFPFVSGGIDEIWHAMILDSRKYSEFCMQCAHSHIHHRPKESRPMNEREKVATNWFFNRYAQWFGEKPSDFFSAIPRHNHVEYCSDCA